MMKTLLAGAALAAALASPVAQAAVAFDPFAGWSAFGDVGASTGSRLLTTAALASGEAPVSASDALLWFDLEAALGTAFDGDTVEGSGLAASFASAAGVVVSLDWRLETEGFDPGFADRAYAVVDGVASVLATTTALPQTGRFTFTLAGPAPRTLGFAVLDVGDVAGVSRLELSNLAVTPVPEPAAALLFAGGLGVLAALRGRRTAPGVR